ncbi:MAG: hypothetical protein K2F59_01795 [Eubacteriales bacterium]|nr:hypothetical protein [Eubacteriales bacterium]
MYKLKLDNVVKIVDSDFEKERLIKQGYILFEEKIEEIQEEPVEKIEEEPVEESTEEITEENKKSNKKESGKNGTTK